MDPYEYLLKTLGVQIIDRDTCQEIWFKNQFIDVCYLKMTVKEIFQYYNTTCSLDLIYLFNTESMLDLIQLLQQFPADLESIEHVDLLLALNGLNKED